MKNLWFYLNDAQDYEPGTMATKQLMEFYKNYSNRAEQLWEMVTSDPDSSVDITEFNKLAELYGLYVQVADSHSNDPEDHVLCFKLRIYTDFCNQVACLKCINLPQS